MEGPLVVGSPISGKEQGKKLRVRDQRPMAVSR